MSSHEDMLELALAEIRKTGLRTIRLDNRDLPDAFVIVDEKIIAIEIETDGSPKYSRESEFDEVITVGPVKDYKDHRHNIYLMVLRLRKEGLSYRNIKKYVQDVSGVVLGISTIHDWCRGKSRPRSIFVTR